MKIDKLTITLEFQNGVFTASCLDLGCSKIDEFDREAMLSLREEILEKLLDLQDTGQLECTPLIDNLFCEEIVEQVRHQRFLNKLELAFVKAYPAAEGYWNISMLIPHYFWDDESGVWKEKQLAAYNALIESGKHDQLWVEWVQEITAINLRNHVEYQRKEVYEGWVKLGLPVKPYKEICGSDGRSANRRRHRP